MGERWDDSNQENAKAKPAIKFFITVLALQLIFNIIGGVLYGISYQFVPCIIFGSSAILCIATIIGTVKKNYSIIAVYLFIEPLYVASYVFLLLVYLQVTIFTLPYNGPPSNTITLKENRSGGNTLEASGDFSGDDFSDDEDLPVERNRREMVSESPVDKELITFTLYDLGGYMTLNLYPMRRSFMLVHPALQKELLPETNGFVQTLTIGRLLESTQLLIMCLLGLIGFIAAYFAYFQLKKRDENSWTNKYEDLKFSYQSHRSDYSGRGEYHTRYEPRSTDELLKHQNSADRLLSAHHSVTENSYSSRSGPYTYRQHS